MPARVTPELDNTEGSSSFQLTLNNFSGPFDLLLQLISRRKLDITEVALSQVTDEFIQYVKAGSPAWQLEETSSFLVVAATLLDLKAARLLPSGQVDDEEDLALLEARDLLFARLLQYRAFKDVAAYLARELAAESKYFAPDRGIEPQFASLLPEVVIPGGADRLVKVAARLLAPQKVLAVSLEHLHAPQVSVAEQASWVVGQLKSGPATFRVLTRGVERIVVVARFLALLELFKEGIVAFEQLTPLGELTIRWTADDETEFTIGEFDD